MAPGWMGGGVRGDGCRKTPALSGKTGNNLGFPGRRHGASSGTRARAEGTRCEDA